MMWYTFGWAIDTCFARKSQLSITSSGELFLRVARIKTSVVHGLSIYKAASNCQQCVLHAFGLLFACAPEPSEYIFPLVPRLAKSDLPGETPLQHKQKQEENRTEQATVKTRARPNISKYINGVINQAFKSANQSGQVLIFSSISHSIHRGTAAYTNGSSKFAIQWISTRGSWLLDSLTKAFAYIGTTTKEDQSVAKVLVGYGDPDFPVATPTTKMLASQLPALDRATMEVVKTQLFQSISGFTGANEKLNVPADVLDASSVSLLIHLPDVVETEKRERNSALSRYTYRFRCALQEQTTNSVPISRWQTAATGVWCWRAAGSSATTFISAKQARRTNSSSSRRSRNSWRLSTAFGKCCAASSWTQATSSRPRQDTQAAALKQSRHRGDDRDVSCYRSPAATSLAGVFYSWNISRPWEAGADKKEQNARSEMKLCIKILEMLCQEPAVVPDEPLKREVTLYKSWKQEVWTLGTKLDQVANKRLRKVGKKKTAHTASSARKRWKKIETAYPDHFLVLSQSQQS